MQVRAEKGVTLLQPAVEPPDIFLMARLTGIEALVNKGRGHRIQFGLIFIRRCGFFIVFNGLKSITWFFCHGRTDRKKQTQQDGGNQELPCLFQRGCFRHHGLQTERCFKQFKRGASIRLNGDRRDGKVMQLNSNISLLMRFIGCQCLITAQSPPCFNSRRLSGVSGVSCFFKSGISGYVHKKVQPLK